MSQVANRFDAYIEHLKLRAADARAISPAVVNRGAGELPEVEAVHVWHRPVFPGMFPSTPALLRYADAHFRGYLVVLRCVTYSIHGAQYLFQALVLPAHGVALPSRYNATDLVAVWLDEEFREVGRHHVAGAEHLRLRTVPSATGISGAAGLEDMRLCADGCWTATNMDMHGAGVPKVVWGRYAVEPAAPPARRHPVLRIVDGQYVRAACELPERVEKNWVPFEVGERTRRLLGDAALDAHPLVVYTYQPLIIVDQLTGRVVYRDEAVAAQPQLRGSSQTVQLSRRMAQRVRRAFAWPRRRDLRAFHFVMVHEAVPMPLSANRAYCFRFALFAEYERDARVHFGLRVSRAFVASRASRIEYAAGLCASWCDRYFLFTPSSADESSALVRIDQWAALRYCLDAESLEIVA